MTDQYGVAAIRREGAIGAVSNFKRRKMNAAFQIHPLFQVHGLMRVNGTIFLKGRHTAVHQSSTSDADGRASMPFGADGMTFSAPYGKSPFLLTIN